MFRQNIDVGRRTALIGHTGFVGGNLATQWEFTHGFNSKNIESIAGSEFDLVVCAGVPAVKWWANNHPDEDRENIARLLFQLKTVSARKAILVSTVDVYSTPRTADERQVPSRDGLHPYGLHRLDFEDAFRSIFPDHHVVRLPGLFGSGLKKNVIYDLLHDNLLEAINPESAFQWYDLSRLGEDLALVIKHNIRLINIATEPVKTGTIRDLLFPGKAIGTKAGSASLYDVRSIHADIWAGRGGYLFSEEKTLSDLEDFVSKRPRS